MNDDAKLQILFLEDDRRDVELVSETLAAAAIDCELIVVHDRAAFEAAISDRIDLILADFAQPGFSGMDGLILARKAQPDVPFLFVSGAIGEDQLIDLLTHGATDYVLKTRLKRLGPAVRRALGEAHDRAERWRAVAELETSETRLRATFDHACVGMAHLSADGRWLRVNKQLSEMFGLDTAHLIGQPLMRGIEPQYQAMLQAQWQGLQNGECAAFETELRLCCAAPLDRWVHMAIWAGHQRDDVIQYLTATFVDITERKNNEAALRASEQALQECEQGMRLAQQIGRIGTFNWNVAANRVHWSAEIAPLYGFPAQAFEIPYATWRSLVHPDDLGVVEKQIEQALKSGSLEGEWRVIWPDGSVHWLAGRAVVYHDQHGRPQRMLGVNIDISDRKQTEEQIRRVAQHDTLTGLPNRALLYEFAEHVLPAMRRGHSHAAFLFLDLDRFKPVNDTYGHDVGDAVLKEVARRLTTNVRAEDLVGRLGGDEFVAVLTHLHGADDAARVAAHLLDHLDRPYIANGVELCVSPSIGISLFPEDGERVEELIKCADVAMYSAKQKGRNNFQFFRPDFNGVQHVRRS